jgi:tetratricopeptide (TPR) repeat protein
LRLLGRITEAEPELLRAIQLGIPEKQGQREATLLLATQDWHPQVEGLIRQVVTDNPDDAEVQLAVADSYAAKGQWEKAEPLYTRCIKLGPDQSELYFKRGVARMRAAVFATAADDFRTVLATAPDRYEARLFLGHSLLGDARMQEAERELLICRQQRPDAIEPLVGLATCAVERNDLAGAEKLLMEANNLVEKSPLVLQELASLYLRQRRTELAITTLKQLVAIDPKHRQGHLQLAQAYLASGNQAEASKHEQIYRELDIQEEARLRARRGMR